MRTLPKVRQTFEAIFDTRSLLVSFDGGNIFRPWHHPTSDEYSKTRSGWFHVDQGQKLHGLHAIQGLVTLTDANRFTGGFCCIPGSHHLHESLLVATKGQGDRNFVIVPPTFAALTQKQILPVCSAGDLVLWDSRTIHCNTPSLVTPDTTAHPQDKLLRAVGYVCMTPAKWADEKVIRNRTRIYERGLGTTHWPHFSTYEVTEDSPSVIVKDLASATPEERSLITGEI